MTSEEQHPTKTMVEDISRFTEDIESLHMTFPVMMGLTSVLRRDTQKKYQDFWLNTLR